MHDAQQHQPVPFAEEDRAIMQVKDTVIASVPLSVQALLGCWEGLRGSQGNSTLGIHFHRHHFPPLQCLPPASLQQTILVYLGIRVKRNTEIT